jgi:PKD repeat protein
MKTITKHLKSLAILVALLGFGKTFAQGCFPTFTYNVNPNGTVTFTGAALGANSITTQYFWNFPGGSPSTFSGTGVAGTTISVTYPASGIYTVNLFALSAPSCSNSITQTIVAINNTPTCNITVSTTAASGTATCNGSATVTNVTGLCGAPSYTWIPGGMSGASVAGLCPGTVYTVVASGGTGTNCCATVSNTMVVTPTNPCNLVPSFSFIPGANGQVFYFSTSVGTTSLSTYSWNFGNGQSANGFSTAATYTSNGVYTVTLTVSVSPSCTASVVQTLTITNVGGNPCNLNANFTYSLLPNGVLNIFNTSTGTASNSTYVYFVTPAAFSSTLANPSFSFTSNGIYTVHFGVTNPNPLCVDSLIQIIVVNNIPVPCNLVAGFTHTVGANGVVNFGNTSTGTVANTVYFWNFGDGTTGFGANPNHTYPSAGAYFVLMTAINNSLNCLSTASTAINVTGINCVANSNFSIAPTNTAQYWTATPAFPWNISNAVWSWGDGSSSNGLYSSHTYSAAGLYQICLNVTVSCGSSASTCATYSISKMSSANAMIQINVVPPQLIEVGIANQVNAFNGFNFYPNPNNGLLNLELNSTNNAPYVIQIIDLSGRIVFTTNIDSAKESNQNVIDLHQLPNGVYILQLEQAGQRLKTKLVISKD